MQYKKLKELTPIAGKQAKILNYKGMSVILYIIANG